MSRQFNDAQTCVGCADLINGLEDPEEITKKTGTMPYRHCGCCDETSPNDSSCLEDYKVLRGTFLGTGTGYGVGFFIVNNITRFSATGNLWFLIASATIGFFLGWRSARQGVNQERAVQHLLSSRSLVSERRQGDESKNLRQPDTAYHAFSTTV